MGMKVHFLVHAVYPPKLKAEYNFVTRLCHTSSVTLGKAANNLLPKVDCQIVNILFNTAYIIIEYNLIFMLLYILYIMHNYE